MSLTLDDEALFAYGFLDLTFNLLRLALSRVQSSLHAQLLLASPSVVVQESVALCQLGALVDEVAQEQEVVLRSDGHGVAHKGRGVDAEGKGHGPRDSVQG